MSAPTPAPDTPQGNTAPVVASQGSGLDQAVQTDAVRSLAATLLQPDATGAVILKGTVTAGSLTTVPPTISIQLGGDTATTIPNVRFLDSYWPVVGDTILVAKQGSSLFALGQIQAFGVTPADQGWVTPTPATNWTAATDTLRYRVVTDGGTRKVQLRGGLSRTGGTPTLMWTMPSDARPPINLQPLVIARDSASGSTVAQMSVNADGTMVLTGYSAGVASVGTSTSSDDPNDNTTTVNTDHKHDAWDNGGAGDPVFGDYWSSTVIWSFTGTQGVSHSHGVVGAHSHSVSVTNVSHPSWVSFNGVEYFI